MQIYKLLDDYFENRAVCTNCDMTKESTQVNGVDVLATSQYKITFSLADIFQLRGNQCSGTNYHKVYAINEEGERYNPDYVEYEVNSSDEITVKLNKKEEF